MSAVRNWLEEIGLSQYADAFEANDIDMDLLTRVDDQLLKDIGVSSADGVWPHWGVRMRAFRSSPPAQPAGTILDTSSGGRGL